MAEEQKITRIEDIDNVKWVSVNGVYDKVKDSTLWTAHVMFNDDTPILTLTASRPKHEPITQIAFDEWISEVQNYLAGQKSG